MRQLLFLLFIGFCITFTSCRDDFHFETSTGGLEFSKDTVYLDTVFTNIGSSTYTLKVYNRSNKDISIPSIRLSQGQNSKYRLMVDGMPGKEFTNVELLAKDSMFVFIETTASVADANPTDFLYTDKIEFTSTNGTQNVELVTLIQDAYFLYPQRLDGGYEGVPFDDETNIYGFYLDESDPNNGNEYHWRNDKPYVIYGYATVPSGKTLTVDPGARVHFHADSGLMVRPGGRLLVNGALSTTEALENEVIFEGDRLEPAFSDVAGQWSAVLIMSNAENEINHLTLKNANIGIYAFVTGESDPQPKVTIKNSQIYNCTNFGIYGVHANITGENIVANNAGQVSVAFALGGTYNFKYCTFANYFNSYDQVPLLLNNYQDSGDRRTISSLSATFDNCIVYGSGNVGLSLEKQDANEGEQTPPFRIKFNNCLIKLVDFNRLENAELYPFTGNNSTLVEYTTGCKIARSSLQNRPNFKNAQNNNLRLLDNNTEGEGPYGTADATVTTSANTDIKGASRGSAPDMGAYESIAE
jgi:hypothetical protein